MSHRSPSRAIYRLLLRAYPRAFREEFGEEMTALFGRRLRRARERRPWTGPALLWARTLADVVVSAGAERLGLGASLTDGAGPARGHETTTRRGSMWASLGQDLKHALRRLFMTPGFTVSAVLVVTLGIGANSAMFSLVNAVLLRPPPFQEPGRLVDIYQDSDDGEPSSSSFPAYRDMAAFDDVFQGVAAWSGGGATWQREEGAENVRVAYVTSSFLPVVGLRPAAGRWFTPDEDVPGGGEVAVLSHRLWEEALGADPDVVGGTVRLNGRPVTVVGVAPVALRGPVPGESVDLWLSISTTLVGGSFRVANLDRRQDHWYTVKARLGDGVTVEQARAAMDNLASRLAEEYPELNRGRDITVFGPGEVRVHPQADADLAGMGWLLMGLVGMVLLIACANLGNMLLVRGAARAREMGIRRALGAGRGRIMRHLLLESLLVAGAGGAAGLWLAWTGARFLPALSATLPIPAVDVVLDHRVVLFTLGISLATGLIFGFVPALRASGTDVVTVLREDGPRSSGGERVGALRNLLVGAQVAVSVVLLVGAGLLIQSLAKMARVEPGFPAGELAVLTTNFAQAGLAGDEVDAAYRELRERIEAVPGVRGVALTTRLPLDPRTGSTTTVVEGYTPPTGTGSVELDFAAVDGRFFATMGIPLLAGRGFTPDDLDLDADPVVVVNETLALRFWGSTDVVGRRTRPQGSPDGWSRVVGVVEDTPVRSLREGGRPLLYFPGGSPGGGPVHLVVRSDVEPSGLVVPLREALREVNASLPLLRAATMESWVGRTLSTPRAGAALLSGFALLALLLAATGIYAVVSFAVTQRRSEIGIRMALGADAFRVVRTVLREVLLMVGVAAVAGLGVALVGASRLRDLFFRLELWDPLTLAGVTGTLLLAAALATWLPARRAARADPATTLRGE